MRVAFFQRMFASYQLGLVKELAAHSSHVYEFFGDRADPLHSGIRVIPQEICQKLPFTYCRTKHYGAHLAFQWRAVREALSGRFDVFVFEGSLTMPTNWMALLSAKVRGKRVYFYTHGWTSADGIFKRVLRRGLFGPADGLLLYGWRARRIGEKAGYPPRRLHVVYNCLDDEEIRRQVESLTEARCREFRREWFGQDADNPVIASVGRLAHGKRFSLLVDAAAVLLRQGLHVNLLLVGDGPERESLAEQAKEAGVRLAFAGAQYDESFLSLALASADLAVIPGAAGLSVIHSLSYGTPVVVHGNDAVQMPETEAVEDGLNGAIFREGDVGDLARSISRILRELPRGPIRATRCRRVIEAKYSPARMREAFDRAISGDAAPDSPQPDEEVLRA